jgi:hypothetical protein
MNTQLSTIVTENVRNYYAAQALLLFFFYYLK